MEADPPSTTGETFRRVRRRIKFRPAFLIALAIILGAYDIWAAINLTEAEPDDAKTYSQIARNVLDVGMYSTESFPPFTPTLIRLPGYPMLIAGTYSVFGEGNNNAVRMVQGILHALSALLAGLLAWNWSSGRRRSRRAAAVFSFTLAAVCPFTLIYTGVLLTEVPTMFLMAALALLATSAIKASGKRSVFYWALAGLAAGIGVEFRPDFGLPAAGIGITIVIASFISRPPPRALIESLVKGTIYSLLFVVILAPWTIRNYRVFGIFQPIAPAHGEMPDEFVPHGYLLWLRTWITDFRYVDSLEWGLEQKRVDVNTIPVGAFASDAERMQVSALIDRYNNSDPEHPLKVEEKKNSEDDGTVCEDESNEQSDDLAPPQPQDEDEDLNLRIDPDVDAAFAEIANERIHNDPLSFYLTLPADRMANMWFDTHSDYYSFAGELFPLKDLDSETYQNLWLPLFMIIVWTYSLTALAGLVIMIAAGWPKSAIFALMLFLIIVPRAVFIGRLENPEPRYFVEYFIFAEVLSGIFLSRFVIRIKEGRLDISLLYGRERIRKN